MESLGDRVKHFRVGLGLKQEDVAEQVGLPKSAISKIENGAQAIKAEEALRFARVFQVDVGTLLGEKPATSPFGNLLRVVRTQPPVLRKEYAALLRSLADDLEALPPVLDVPAT